MKYVLAILLIVVAIPAAAEEAAMPRLGAHRFVPASSIEEPFIVTQVETSVSLGQAISTSRPGLTLPDSTVIGGLTSEQLFIGLRFAYQHAMKEWLAVQVSLAASGRLGANTTTLLSDGVTGAVGYTLGWKLNVFDAEPVKVTGSLGLSNDNATFINLIKWAESVIGSEDASLVQGHQSLRGSGGLQAAWGINQRFGLIGSLLLDYGESFTGTQANGWAADARLGLSYDMARELKVPLGLIVAGGYTTIAELDKVGALFWSARLALQTRSDFSIGIDMGMSYYDNPEYEVSAHTGHFSIDMRYYY